MKSYPSITTKIKQDTTIYAFDKLDGSNIRAEWSKKKGFCKFGTRTRLLDPSEPILGPSQDMILEKYGDDLDAIFRRQRYERVVTFFEYGGPSSFAGSHDLNEERDVVLFDADIYKKGLMEPKSFIETFGHLDIPKLLYKGEITEEFYNSVKDGTLEDMTFEGVICKYKHPKLNSSEMFKIKNRAWILKLQDYCDNNIGSI
jgi:hypothetical protein